MRVLFVYSVWPFHTPEKPLFRYDQIQFGIAYISSLLKQYGHEIKLFVVTEPINTEMIDAQISGYQPKILCFTAMVTEYDFLSHVAQYVRSQYPDIFLLIGGVHVSLVPEESMLNIFDALCIGEGEYPTLELVEQLSRGEKPSGIANLWINNNGIIEKNPTRPFLQDLDSLPFPDRDMWLDWIDLPPDASIESTRVIVLVGRGCPFLCSYCCNHALRKLSAGPYVRMRSPANIVAELETIVRRFPETLEIFLEVETFGANINWALQVCSALETFNTKHHFRFCFGVNLRVTSNGQYEPLFKAMKRCGFRYINIGLESGSERIRREVLNRNESNDDIIRAVELVRACGLEVTFYNMMGVPGETFEDFLETVKMNHLCRPESKSLPISIFFPYPGTKLYDLCKAQGLLQQQLDIKHERIQAVLDLPGFSMAEQEKAFKWADDFDLDGNVSVHAILRRRFPGFYQNFAQHTIVFTIFQKLVRMLPAIPGKELLTPSYLLIILKKLCDTVVYYHQKLTRR